MNGEKRFLIPGDLWDTGLLEQWLEEKTLHGWFPVSFGGLRGKFEKSEPRTCRFRLEPDRAETLDPESAALEMDWQQYERDRGLLVPDRCEIEQFRWDFGPRLEARFDRVRFTFLAELLYDERLAATEQEFPGLDLTAVEDPEFDEAVLLTGGRIQIFLGRRGTAVLWEYTVLDTDLEAHLAGFAQVLADVQ